MTRWSDGEMGRWNDGAMGRWSDDAMERWSEATKLRRDVIIEISELIANKQYHTYIFPPFLIFNRFLYIELK